MSRAAAWIVLLLTRTASSSFIPGSNTIFRRRNISIIYATASSTSTHQQHGGLPIGAVQLSGAHVESFKDLVAKTLYTSSIFRGVEPFIGPGSRTQQSRQMLIHVSPVVATALDDNHPTLLKFVEENNGVYIPGLRRSSKSLRITLLGVIAASLKYSQYALLQGCTRWQQERKRMQ